MKSQSKFALIAVGLCLCVRFGLGRAVDIPSSDQQNISHAVPPNAAGKLSLIAGNTDGVGSKDGIGRDAQFSYAQSEIGMNPKGIASDAFNNLYVADVGNHTIRKITPDGAVTTVAGKAGVPGSADGIGSEARFYYPTGIAVDKKNNIYVADSANHTIRKITPEGIVSTLAGKPGVKGNIDGAGAEARFRRPKGIAVDDKGIIYVADTFNNAIREINPDGQVSTLHIANAKGFYFPHGSRTLFDHPSDVAISFDGEIVVADKDHQVIQIVSSTKAKVLLGGRDGDVNGKLDVAHISWPAGLGVAKDGIYVTNLYDIRKIGQDGMVSTVAGQREQSGYFDGNGNQALFSLPGNLASDSFGNMYVADGLTVRKINSSGEVSTIAGQQRHVGADDIGGGPFSGMPGLLVKDQLWNLYVVDGMSSMIHKIDSKTATGLLAGGVTRMIGQRGFEGEGYLDGPIKMAKFSVITGLAVDDAGNFYVSDYKNNVIRKISQNGSVSTIAGIAGKKGILDGESRHASFDAPGQIVIDKHKNLFVVDQNDKVIRKISSHGEVTTFAGRVNGILEKVDGVGRDAGFGKIHSMTIDQAGNLYALDEGLIRKISPTGVVTTIGDFSGEDADGTRELPYYLVADGLGNLYYTFDTTVRKLTPRGEVFTVAGVLGRHGIELGKLGVLDDPCGLTMLDNKTMALISGNAILRLELP